MAVLLLSCTIFYFREIFRQATVGGNLLPLFPNESKTTKKTVLNTCFKTSARLLKSWPILYSRLAMTYDLIWDIPTLKSDKIRSMIQY